MILPAPGAFTIAYKAHLNQLQVPVSIHPLGESDTTKFINETAIWDTGAQSTAITTALVQKLGLVPTGRTRNMHTPSGGVLITRQTYLVDIILPRGIHFKEVEVTECDNLMGQSTILLGMDIIAWGDMHLSNFKLQTVLTYRIPPSGSLDYHADFKKANAPIVNSKGKRISNWRGKK